MPYGGENVSDPGVNVAYDITLESPAGGRFVDPSGSTVSFVTGTDASVTAALHSLKFVADPLANGKEIDGTVHTTVVEQNGEVSSGRPIYELGISNYSVVTPPSITGTVANANAGTPFANVVVTDGVNLHGDSFSKVGATITESVNFQPSDTAGKLVGIAETAPGVYQLSAADAATLSKELNGITFSGVPGTVDRTVQFSLNVINDHGLSSVDNATSVIVPSNPPPPAPQTVAVAAHDNTTGADLPDTSSPYTGPVAGISSQFIDITPDNLNVTAKADNLFIKTGAGNDAIALHGGTNVADAGGGSNFLTSGSGFDTFFLDARNIPPAASAAGPVPGAIWDTIQNFGHGDAATLWGIGPGTALAWQRNEGAVGHTGLTLHAIAPNGATTSLTLAGVDNTSHLALSYGQSGGANYLYVNAI